MTPHKTFKAALGGAALLAGALLALALPAAAQTLRVAMTASDLPTTGGIPDQGGEGLRFAGFPVYDGLINWDFSKPDRIAGLTPGLATSWAIDPENPKRWYFKLRKGVKFHDGTDFNADAVIFNFQRIFDDKAPHYDGAQAAIVRVSMPMLESFEKVDEDTIALNTKFPISLFPYLVTRVLMVSPTAYAKIGNWQKFMLTPAGTGPFRITKVTSRVSIEMVRNTDYWDKTRVPKLEKMVLFPMPEANTRLAALRSGQVDWIEVPPPDSIPSLKGAGFQISLWPYPHIWPWFLSQADGSPFKDKRVRYAINYAVDRDGLIKLLNGTAKPASGFYDPENVLYGKPEVKFTYDPAKAKALLKEAGYGPDKPVKAKIMISTSGSGQMMPIPMNELVQQNLKDVGIEVEFETVDWGTMLVAARNPPTAAMSKGTVGMNFSSGFSDPVTLFRFFHTASFPPGGNNWAQFAAPAVDEGLNKAYATFDETERNAILAKVHETVVNDAAWLFIVHDLNPRAMSPKVKGFQPAQSWFQDFTQVTVVK
ncbi:ABC transporter substrate-binding protein [Prosthecomicrobium sp. N25]|uniref:ABC transporter substrate-binding protein n=1 Tax=Prosthecomicrobium sp. N25 TaxID=3129254 RepID=UPI003077CF1B